MARKKSKKPHRRGGGGKRKLQILQQPEYEQPVFVTKDDTSADSTLTFGILSGERDMEALREEERRLGIGNEKKRRLSKSKVVPEEPSGIGCALARKVLAADDDENEKEIKSLY